MCLQVLVSIERYLTGNLRDSPPDVEALRVFLTLPYCAAFSDPEHHMSIIVPFASALLKLQPKPRDVLGESDRAASAAFTNVSAAHENRQCTSKRMQILSGRHVSMTYSVFCPSMQNSML